MLKKYFQCNFNTIQNAVQYERKSIQNLDRHIYIAHIVIYIYILMHSSKCSSIRTQIHSNLGRADVYSTQRYITHGAHTYVVQYHSIHSNPHIPCHLDSLQTGCPIQRLLDDREAHSVLKNDQGFDF